jgi:hypothetical protein
VPSIQIAAILERTWVYRACEVLGIIPGIVSDCLYVPFKALYIAACVDQCLLKTPSSSLDHSMTPTAKPHSYPELLRNSLCCIPSHSTAPGGFLSSGSSNRLHACRSGSFVNPTRLLFTRVFNRTFPICEGHRMCGCWLYALSRRDMGRVHSRMMVVAI